MPRNAFGPWAPNLKAAERKARWRSLLALATVFAGADHPLCASLRAAERDRAARADALVQLDALPALLRRRLLAAYSRVHNGARGMPGANA